MLLSLVGAVSKDQENYRCHLGKWRNGIAYHMTGTTVKIVDDFAVF